MGDNSFRSSLIQLNGRISARKKGKPSKAWVPYIIAVCYWY